MRSPLGLHVTGTYLKEPSSCRGLMKRQRTIAVTGWAHCQRQVAFLPISVLERVWFWFEMCTNEGRGLAVLS